MRIALAIGSRANWGSLRGAALALRRRGADVVPVLFASALSERFGDVPASLRGDGFESVVRLSGMADPVDMASVAGAAAISWSQWLANEKPDAVLVCGDRHECLGAAMAAAYAGVRLVHTMGGEQSGCIDDRVRDAITALADEHCVATKGAAARVYALTQPKGQGLLYQGELVGAGGGAVIEYEGKKPVGINFWPHVHVTGCPRIDTCREATEARSGMGSVQIFPSLPVIMVSVHPDTEQGDAENQIMTTATLTAAASAAREHGLGVELFWPNADSGTDGVSKAIRAILNSEIAEAIQIRTHRAMGPTEYARMMAGCRVLVGNSSSGIREGAWLGTPCVNVGNRQRGRERAENVIDATTATVGEAIATQLRHGRYAPSELYGDGTAGERVAEVVLGT
jgi:UDP-N-acetylglucosamine 2-epimerase